MKKRLYLKLLIGYVIFGILGFILVSTFSSHYTYEYIEDMKEFIDKVNMLNKIPAA